MVVVGGQGPFGWTNHPTLYLGLHLWLDTKYFIREYPVSVCCIIYSFRDHARCLFPGFPYSRCIVLDHTSY